MVVANQIKQNVRGHMSKSGDRGCLGADKGSDLLNGNKSGKLTGINFIEDFFPQNTFSGPFFTLL